MKLLAKKEIPVQRCYDLTVKKNSNFVVNGVVVHNSNAAVRIEKGQVFFQKRSADVTPLHDNAGFAGWAQLVDWSTTNDCIIYGEWAGPGVQKSDAVSQIDRKRFFVYAVVINQETGNPDEPFEEMLIFEPEIIRHYIPDHPDVYLLPWFDDPTTLNYRDLEGAREFSDLLNTRVEQIGKCDPYIQENFDVEGPGEGLVVAPYHPQGYLPLWLWNSYCFKVKSEAHLTQKTSNGKSASVYVEIPGSVHDFCDAFVTDVRAEQMIQEHCEGSYAMQQTGNFLKAMNLDILKESKNELAALGVEWAVVQKEITRRAVAWLKAKNKV